MTPSAGLRTRLLVSVRSAAEAEAALEGGADLLDVKEPDRGPLGRANEAVVREVVLRMAGRRPVSAALGELAREPHPPAVAGLTYGKWGLGSWPASRDWRQALRDSTSVSPFQTVTVAYADWQKAGAPPALEVLQFALSRPGSVLLLDTFGKAPGHTLLDWLPIPQIHELCQRCRQAGVRVALAGSLGLEEVRALLCARPDWFAVRGAACTGGRLGSICAGKVRALANLMNGS
jgi:uncharacterized protein (UPF0264 family)